MSTTSINWPLKHLVAKLQLHIPVYIISQWLSALSSYPHPHNLQQPSRWSSFHACTTSINNPFQLSIILLGKLYIYFLTLFKHPVFYNVYLCHLGLPSSLTKRPSLSHFSSIFIPWNTIIAAPLFLFPLILTTFNSSSFPSYDNSFEAWQHFRCYSLYPT